MQVTADHYFNDQYLIEKRFSSFRFLLLEVLARKFRHIAEVGKGAGILTAMLRAVGVKVTTIDYAEDLSPDLCMDLRELGDSGHVFDCVVCSQVLEHLPYEELGRCVRSLAKAARREVMITIPDRRPYLEFAAKIPLMCDRRIRWDLPIPGRRWVAQPGAEHLWEMNRPPYLENEVLGIIQRSVSPLGFGLAKHQRIPGFPTHHFISLSSN